jgi:phosphoribulokinase
VKFADSTLSLISTRIAAVNPRPVVVGVDGQSGSGKSTLAQELAQSLSLSVAIVRGDDFYSDTPASTKALLTPKEGYEKYFDWRRLRSDVIESIRDGASTLRYQRYDWNTAAMGGWTELPMPEVVIIEGVYTLRPELRGAIDITVFVRTSESTRLQRQKSRSENSVFWINQWIAAEDFYVSSEATWEWVNFLLEGE